MRRFWWKKYKAVVARKVRLKLPRYFVILTTPKHLDAATKYIH